MPAKTAKRVKSATNPQTEWKPRKIRIGSVSVPYVSMQIAERNDRARKQGVAR